MPLEFFDSSEYQRILINGYRPVISYKSMALEKMLDSRTFTSNNPEFEIKIESGKIIISMPLEIGSHVLGLGEKALGLDRKRKRLISVNTDPGGYERGRDPIYFPIPFFIKTLRGKCQGVFVNYPGEVIFDLGVEAYNKITIIIQGDEAEIYLFKPGDFKSVVRAFIGLTGKPFMPPRWAIGHSISRYTYYPENEVKELIDRYKETTKVDALYLDIDFMDGYRLFTWNKNYFRNNFLDEMQKREVKVITIVNPSIKMDQNFDLYRSGLGHFMETANGDIYTGKMWPGNSVFLDFLNEGAREFWKDEIRKWVSQGIDGIWLDMNEPTVLTVDHLFDGNAKHHLDDGTTALHKDVRNAYPYFQNLATYEALSEISKEPFILTRSGYAGVQGFAAAWTGDNVATWDDVKLQISVVTSLSISGITVIGCDLGGFIGDAAPELILAYYRMAMFFPIYRNHKDVRGKDQEVFLMPSKARKDICDTIDMRYSFMDHLYSLLHTSHKEGIPVIAPLVYEFPDDEDCYHVEDEYLVGDSILYAPQIYEGRDERSVYLPKGKWFDFWTKQMHIGPEYFTTKEKFPIYLKDNSCTIFGKKIIVAGRGKHSLFLGGKEISIDSDGKSVTVSPESPEYKPEIIG